MLTMSYFSLLVNYYLYYYINHSRFWPILSRDLLKNKILQKRINNEKVTVLFTGVQIITSNSIKLDFWSTPKGRFSMRWYIGVCWNIPKACPYIKVWFARLAYCQGSHGLHRFYMAFFVGEKSHGWTDPSKPSLGKGLPTTQQTQQEGGFNESWDAGVWFCESFNLWKFVAEKSLQQNICVIREIRGSKTSHEFVSFGVRLWVRQHFNPSRIYSNIDSIFFGVMTL